MDFVHGCLGPRIFKDVTAWHGMGLQASDPSPSGKKHRLRRWLQPKGSELPGARGFGQVLFSGEGALVLLAFCGFLLPAAVRVFFCCCPTAEGLGVVAQIGSEVGGSHREMQGKLGEIWVAHARQEEFGALCKRSSFNHHPFNSITVGFPCF